MFLRFTTLEVNDQSNRKTGILVAAHELRDEGDLPSSDDAALRDMLGWFNEHLKIPRLLSDDEHYRALSWFKPEAKEALKRAWDLKNLLESNGLTIEVHKTNDPGIVCYSDGWQVVAKPKK